jgi:hypothetical protein
MSFRLIEAEKAEHRVSRLCSVLAVTRAGYYAWKRRPPSARPGRPRGQETDRPAHAPSARAGRFASRQAASRPACEQARCSTGARPRPPALRRRAAGRALARRDHPRPHLAGLTLPEPGHGRVHAHDRRLVDARGPASRARRRARNRGHATSSERAADPSPRPRPAVRLASLPARCATRACSRASAQAATPRQRHLRESVVSTLNKEELLKRRSSKTRNEACLPVFTYIETFDNPKRRHGPPGYLAGSWFSVPILYNV